MHVKEVMTADVVTVHHRATLRDAVEQLLTESVGSAIVVNDDEAPVGIVTETDVLRAAYKTQAPLSEIAVSDLSHQPVVTTKPNRTVNHVAYVMAKEEVKKVPVMDDMELVGMITLTDIVWRLSDIRQEATEDAEIPTDWDPND